MAGKAIAWDTCMPYWMLVQVQFLVNAPGRQWTMVQVWVSATHVEIWLEFLVSAFSLALS